MRLPLPSSARRPLFPTVKLKKPLARTSTAFPLPGPLVKLEPWSNTLSDPLLTALGALKQSSAAFPPLESAVNGVLAIYDIAQRAKTCRADARDVVDRARNILDILADGLQDPSMIPPSILKLLERFKIHLTEIENSMRILADANIASRLVHLNRNERMIRSIKDRLEAEHDDFRLALEFRVVVQQTDQMQKMDDVLFHSRLNTQQNVRLNFRLDVFLARPLLQWVDPRCYADAATGVLY
ncbi:hypothetical protein R3P38DRAFT_3594003 [Favolaschia claudopus]|uniref:Uncharacterized protein n=1 Tax=Favolaschia claudopus TaxID=2862362 RepID=A0AAW0DGC3_9AGAR